MSALRAAAAPGEDARSARWTEPSPRVAIIHYWLVGMRGGERVLEQLCALFPQADLFTHVCAPESLSPALRRHRVTETFIARLPQARTRYRSYLGLMPRALEELDLSGYDLVLSSESGPAKGVIAPPEAPHLCYCHTPMRYLWDQYPAYKAGLGPIGRAAFSHVAARMRIWDAVSARRPDRIVANSRFVAARVRRFWEREASVVHPPVDLETYRPSPAPGPEAPYLFLSELVPYKRADLAVEACGRLGRPLRVVGSGPEAERLKRAAPSGVEFLGRVADADMPGLYRDCRALLFPAMEDFGIVPLEAMASGRAAIAYGRGGALDTVRDGETGVLFGTQSAEALAAAIERFEAEVEPGLDPAVPAAQAARFSPEAFRAGIWREIRETAPQLGLPEAPPSV
ncbi:MAG: glycosyltransferase [Pseudomonadota bacterium]